MREGDQMLSPPRWQYSSEQMDVKYKIEMVKANDLGSVHLNMEIS